MEFHQNEIVEIFNLGDGKIYKGKICGCSMVPHGNLPGFWIVQPLEKIIYESKAIHGVIDRIGQRFTHLVIIGSCLRKIVADSSFVNVA